MRMAWAVAVLGVYSAVTIALALPKLPARVPTRFNSSGEPVGWGSPETLWIMLSLQVLLSALILAVPAIGRRAPQLVNLGFRRLSDFPPQARQRVMPLLEEMCAWMAVLFAFLFAVLIRGMIRSALDPGARIGAWPLTVFLAGTAIVVIYYLRQINRIADEESRFPSGRDPGDSSVR
jgi:uncharacterized membrane protein